MQKLTQFAGAILAAGAMLGLSGQTAFARGGGGGGAHSFSRGFSGSAGMSVHGPSLSSTFRGPSLSTGVHSSYTVNSLRGPTHNWSSSGIRTSASAPLFTRGSGPSAHFSVGAVHTPSAYHSLGVGAGVGIGTTHVGRANLGAGVNFYGHTATNVLHPVNPLSWHHDNDWGRDHVAWNHDRDWDIHHYHYYGYGIGTLWSPFWWTYDPYYAWRRYPYCEYYGYAPVDYVGYAATPEVTAGYESVVDQPVAADDTSATTGTDWGNQYLAAAGDAFRQGKYADALRLASHANVEMPRNAKPHELMALALFALGDYRGANMEAHAALSLAPACDWNTLYAYYGDVPTYTKQLEALVDYLKEHKDAVDARFVLAYQNLMMGHKDTARDQFATVVSKVPQDQLAARLLKQLGGTPPAAPTPPPPKGQPEGEWH